MITKDAAAERGVESGDGLVITPEEFRAEVGRWSAGIGVTPTAIQLRSMRRKWASCSTAGRLTFDTELLSQPAAFRQQVIVHELLHLKVPNHGALFQALLRAYLACADELSAVSPATSVRDRAKNSALAVPRTSRPAHRESRLLFDSTSLPEPQRKTAPHTGWSNPPWHRHWSMR
jgi:hypothetical protein